jgi:ectoine hydroxylase-related dioxygenase (phytanoyl-CoA dioxygenase family)
LRGWVEELAAWPEKPGAWMKYFEGEARQLCRVENFLPYHEGLAALLGREDLMAALGQLFGEPAVLFKEKVNYKLPGGQGFAAHQDAPAFTSFGQTYHITVMLGVDATTSENGCLQIVDDHSAAETLAQAEDGTVHPDIESELVWHDLPTEPGDVVLFDSYVPHRSEPNAASTPRRALYITYNPTSQGDRRADYYERKRRVFPPECERIAGEPLSDESRVFNLGNPIR